MRASASAFAPTSSVVANGYAKLSGRTNGAKGAKRHATKVCRRRSGGATVASMSSDKDMQVFPEQSQVADALANLTMQAAERAISERGSFTVALAGGSLIKLLGGLKGKSDIDWKNWHVFWVDERCVPHEDAESNFGGAMKALLGDVPIPAAQLYAIDESLCQSNMGAAQPCAEEYDARLKGLSNDILPVKDGLPVFDLLLLGFGPDGHICSLFPEHPLLKVTEPWILPIMDSPKPPDERITFSLPVVNAAKTKCFTAIGEGKNGTLSQWEHEPYAAAEMAAKIIESAGNDPFIPASLVEGNIVWLLDDVGASKLQK